MRNPTSARRSACGTIVDFTSETIGSAQVEVDGARSICVLLRLASTTKTLDLAGKEHMELLSTAKCLNLDHFVVKPIKSLLTSDEGSPTMPPYDQTVEGE